MNSFSFFIINKYCNGNKKKYFIINVKQCRDSLLLSKQKTGYKYSDLRNIIINTNKISTFTAESTVCIVCLIYDLFWQGVEPISGSEIFKQTPKILKRIRLISALFICFIGL